MKTITISMVMGALGVAVMATSAGAQTKEWPGWGHDNSRNMYAPDKGIVELFTPGKFKKGTEEVDMATTKNVRWVAKLGSQSYGNTTVSQGNVLIGTNNEAPRDKKYAGDHSVVYCFEETTGKFLWQFVVPKLGAGRVNDWEFLGICSAPVVEGDRVYVITSRCEVVCLDLNGLKNGNDGPFKEEGQYTAGPGKTPIPQDEFDADIIWRYDMREELGVFPHNIASSSVLILGDKLYAVTSNGQDWSHTFVPSPRAPTLVVLDKKTGQYRGEDVSGIGFRIMHCNWSSPSYGPTYIKQGDKGQVLLGGGDGWLYSYDPDPVPAEDGYYNLKELWKFDCNPPEYKADKNGKKLRYPVAEGPSEIIATPVYYNGRVYVATGQDPEHGEGVGVLTCLRADGAGDVTKSAVIWQNKEIGRSISTVSIADGLVYCADYSGKIFCVDAETGKTIWMHETEAHIWGSTFLVDGRVYIGTEDGSLWIFKHGRGKDGKAEVLHQIEMPAPIYSTPIVANGVLYVATQTHLYAIAEDKK